MRSAGLTISILAASAAIILLVGPFGDFPLSDDWSYAHAARSICFEGHPDLLPWTGASLIAQAWYGAILCKVFGFSFDVLRASTLVLAVVGALLLVRLLSHLGVSPTTRRLALVTVALSPLYVSMAFTFMTDLPFTVFVLAAVYCYSRALDDKAPGMTAAGAALAAVSLLIRQHGLIVVVTAGAAFLFARDRPFGQRLRDAFVASAMPLAAFALYNVWLLSDPGMPPAVTNKLAEASALSIAGTANIAFRAVQTLGLALLPMALLALPRVWRERRGVFLTFALLLSALSVFLYVREGALAFYLTNVQYDFGLGALTLRDVLFLDGPPPFSLGGGFQAALTLAATVGTASALAGLPGRKTLGERRSRGFLVVTAGALLGSSFLHAAFYLDRYLLPILPLAAAALALADDGPHRAAPDHARARRGWRIACWATAAAIACFAVAGTHDYMAWNRARYELLDELENEGVGPEQVDGGMEFNAWRLAAELGTWPTRSDVVPGAHKQAKSWWWVVDDQYVVSFRPLAGYTVRGRRGYATWLAPGEGEILVLERAGS